MRGCSRHQNNIPPLNLRSVTLQPFWDDTRERRHTGGTKLIIQTGERVHVVAGRIGMGVATATGNPGPVSWATCQPEIGF